MNVFEAVKQNLTTRQAAEMYGIRVSRHGMAVCPFHNDKNPSMKVDKRFHCFACQADGDAVDFVSRLFGLPSKAAAMKLADDFGISYDNRQKHRIKPHIRELPRNRDTARKKADATRCCPITSIISGHGSSNTHPSSRRMNGIRFLWKPCKEKAISNICWMFFCMAQLRKRRLWLPSKEKR